MTTTTTRDRGDRYGPIKWAQLRENCRNMQYVDLGTHCNIGSERACCPVASDVELSTAPIAEIVFFGSSAPKPYVPHQNKWSIL